MSGAAGELLARARELEGPLRAGALGEFAGSVSALARADAGAAWGAAALACATAAVAQPGGLEAGATCALLTGGTATATADGDGWLVSGVFHRCAGARAATHFAGEAAAGDGSAVRFLVRADQVTLTGEGAAGAATVALDAVAIVGGDVLGEGPARARAVLLPLALAAVFTGAAERAAEIHTGLLTASAAHAADPDHQRWCGATIMRAAAARTLLRESLEDAPGAPRSDATLGAIAHRVLRYAWDGVAESARTAPTDAGEENGRGELDATARTLLELRADPAPAGEEELARALAREHLARTEPQAA